jgi:hypothetical protein
MVNYFVGGWSDSLQLSVCQMMAGICVTPLTPAQQMVLSLSSILIFSVALTILLLIQLLLMKPHCQCHGTIRRICYPISRYWRSYIQIYLFSYSTLANTLVGYLYCIDVEDDSVIFTLPTISCLSNSYKSWLPVIIILLIMTVLSPPVILLVWLARNRHRFSDQPFIDRWGILFEPYTSRAFWWQCMVLLRRVVFSMTDLVLSIWPSFKFMSFAFIHLLSLLIHVLVHPYATSLHNNAELLTFTSLTAIAVTVATFPTPTLIESRLIVRVLISILVLAPIILFFLYAVPMGVMKIRLLCRRLRLCYTIDCNNDIDNIQQSSISHDRDADDHDQDNDDGQDKAYIAIPPLHHHNINDHHQQ